MKFPSSKIESASSRPTIVHLSRVTWPGVGGMETAIDGMVGELSRRGFTTRVVSFSDSIRERKSVVRLGAEFHFLPGLGLPMLQKMVGLKSLLQDADIIHVHGVDTLLFQALTHAPPKAQIVTTPHGGFLHKRRFNMVKSMVMRSVARDLFRRSHEVWFASETDARSFAAFDVGGRILPVGLPLERFLSNPRQPVSGRFFLWGRIDTHKGLRDLVRGVEKIKDSLPAGFSIRIGGKGDRVALERVVERAGLKGQVLFLGHLSESELLEELRLCSGALFPSTSESWGITLYEALAAGVPCCVNRIDAFVNVVAELPSCKVEDFHSMSGVTSTLRSFLLAPEQYGESNRRAFGRRWTWKSRGDAFTSTYLQLMGEA